MATRRRAPEDRLTPGELARIQNRAIEWFLRYMADRMTSGDPKAKLSVDRPEYPKGLTADDLRKLADKRETLGRHVRTYWTNRRASEGHRRGGRNSRKGSARETARFVSDVTRRLRRNPQLTQKAAIAAYLATQDPAWEALPASKRQKQIESKRRLYTLRKGKIAPRPKYPQS